MRFVELDTCSRENFDRYVGSKSKRQRVEKTVDRFGRETIWTYYFVGSRIEGKVRSAGGGHTYYLRKN